MNIRSILLLSLCAAIAFLSSCANQKPIDLASLDKEAEDYKNPFEPGSYDHFKAEKKYPKTHNTWTNSQLFPETNSSNAWLKVDLATQRGMLMNGDEVVLDYPICSGTAKHPTPKGEFKILEKIVDKRSNKYGRIYDAEGKVVNTDANAFEDEIPEGGKFVGAAMKYWMRMTWDGVGHHIGPVRRYPASHACVRGPRKIMPKIYSKLKVGSKIVVQ